MAGHFRGSIAVTLWISGFVWWLRIVVWRVSGEAHGAPWWGLRARHQHGASGPTTPATSRRSAGAGPQPTSGTNPCSQGTPPWGDSPTIHRTISLGVFHSRFQAIRGTHPTGMASRRPAVPRTEQPDGGVNISCTVAVVLQAGYIYPVRAGGCEVSGWQMAFRLGSCSQLGAPVSLHPPSLPASSLATSSLRMAPRLAC